MNEYENLAGMKVIKQVLKNKLKRRVRDYQIKHHEGIGSLHNDRFVTEGLDADEIKEEHPKEDHEAQLSKLKLKERQLEMQKKLEEEEEKARQPQNIGFNIKKMHLVAHPDSDESRFPSLCSSFNVSL